MGINTVPQPPYSPDLAPCDFWLFPKLKENLRDCHYETIEEMKEAVMKVTDTLTPEDFHGAFQKYKFIAAGGNYIKRGLSFMCVLSIKVPIQKSQERYNIHNIKSEIFVLFTGVTEPFIQSIPCE